MTETTVFQSGNSQAVRLPKDFRFKSKTVEIFRRGNEVVLREKPRTMGEAWAQALQGVPALTATDRKGFDQALAIARQPQTGPERDWSWLESEPLQALQTDAHGSAAMPARTGNAATTATTTATTSGRRGKR